MTDYPSKAKYVIFERHSSFISAFRGFGRFEPQYAEDLPDSHPVNQAFYWYVDERYEECGTTRDLERALGLVRLYHDYDHPQDLEVLSVTPASEQSDQTHDGLLGYDVSDFRHSLLFEQLDFSRFGFRTLPLQADNPYFAMDPLIDLLRRHFQPLLNSNGLFSDASTANHFLACVKAIGHFLPDGFMIEPGREFEVLALAAI